MGSKIKEALKVIKIFNTHDLLVRFADKGRDVAVSYHRAVPRDCRTSCAEVYSPSHKTDPHSWWGDYGKMTFTGQRAEAMQLALAWASEKYGIKEWVPDPTDPTTKVPAEVRARALEKIKS